MFQFMVETMKHLHLLRLIDWFTICLKEKCHLSAGKTDFQQALNTAELKTPSTAWLESTHGSFGKMSNCQVMQRENDMLRNKADWFDLSFFFTASHVLQIGDMVMWRDTPNLQHCLAETLLKENDWTSGTTQLYCTLDFTNSSPTWHRLILTRHRHSMFQCATSVVSMWHPIMRQLIAASRRFKTFTQVSKR